MGFVATSSDPNWPPGASLLVTTPHPERRNVGLLGIPTYATSVTPRSDGDTPGAIRAALSRFSTWSFSDDIDLGEHVALVDYGDVEDPDGPDGFDRVRDAVASFDEALDLRLILGGDNAATWHALRALGGGSYVGVGLVTFDAHLDMRDGISNGSPVRQLLDDGLDPEHVVQVGLADFSNSAVYATRARALGVTLISRDEIRRSSVEEVVARAVALAGGGGRRVYVDVDLDIADRSVVPGCPAAAPGGLSADELRRMVRAAAAARNVFAMDLTEIDLSRDSADERTVRLAALLVLEALAGVTRRVP